MNRTNADASPAPPIIRHNAYSDAADAADAGSGDSPPDVEPDPLPREPRARSSEELNRTLPDDDLAFYGTAGLAALHKKHESGE